MYTANLISLENESVMLFDTSFIGDYIKTIFNKQSKAVTHPRQYKIRWAFYWKKYSNKINSMSNNNYGNLVIVLSLNTLCCQYIPAACHSGLRQSSLCTTSEVCLDLHDVCRKISLLAERMATQSYCDNSLRYNTTQ